ncbi:MAG: hypothetical protein ABI539_09235 [Acidobacteriota bacterium]
MKEKYIQIIGTVVTVLYGVFVLFLYAAEPRSIEDLTVKAKNTIETATTKGQVVIGTYTVDKALFDQGLSEFRAEKYVAARDSFERADPEKRDAKTQFYIAYSYYRQGWGRVTNDDELFKKGSETLARVRILDPDLRVDDPDLQIKTAADLQHEFEEGSKITVDDLNPLKVFRQRK